MPTILLAIDAFSPLDRLLPAAVLLASRQHAELLAVFSQDNRLIRGAVVYAGNRSKLRCLLSGYFDVDGEASSANCR